MVSGLVLLLAADLFWNAVGVHGGGQADTWLLGCAMVGASLLFTVSPMVTNKPDPRRAPLPFDRRVTAIDMGSLLGGAALRIGVAIHEYDLFHGEAWSSRC